MKEGLLWLDDTATRSLADKVILAADRFQQKYGSAPTVCYVHPDALGDQAEARAGGVRVLPARTVLLYHFFLC